MHESPEDAHSYITIIYDRKNNNMLRVEEAMSYTEAEAENIVKSLKDFKNDNI